MQSADDRDRSITTITSWVTPGFERSLRRGAEIANEHGYNYLSEEHVLLALLENRWSYLVRNWPEDAELTPHKLRELLRECLPPVQSPDVGTHDPVRVDTEWFGPHAAEIREQIARAG